MRHNQHGFSVLWFGLLALIVALAGIAGWRVYESTSSLHTSSTLSEAILTGVVTEGPTAPVCTTDKPCEKAVGNHTIEALDSSGNVAATSKTDENGQYTLRLRPGQYTLILVPEAGLGHANNQIDIKAGTTVHDIMVDTGIR